MPFVVPATWSASGPGSPYEPMLTRICHWDSSLSPVCPLTHPHSLRRRSLPYWTQIPLENILAVTHKPAAPPLFLAVTSCARGCFCPFLFLQVGVSVPVTWEMPAVNSCNSEDAKAMGVHPHGPLRPKPKGDPWASPLPNFVFLKGVLLALQPQGRKQVQKETRIFMSKQNLLAQEKPILDGHVSPVAHPAVPTVPSAGVSSGCEPGALPRPQGCSGQILPSLSPPQSPSRPAVDVPLLGGLLGL